MTHLLPPLEVIADNLFGPSEEVIQSWADGVSGLQSGMVERSANHERVQERKKMWFEPVPEDTEEILPSDEDVELPAFLEEMIDKRIASQSRLAQDGPRAGQILRIDELINSRGEVIWELPYPIGVLLERTSDRSDIWHGWLVSLEVDYATEWDVLLEETDQPCDPLAQMVQVWNSLEIAIASTTAVLAELSAERLEEIRVLADEYEMRGAPDSKRAVPGSIMDRYVGETSRLLTGTPLGGEEDPRWHYQSLYRKAAEKITQATGAEVTGSSLFDRLIAQLTEAARSLGESLIPQPFVPQALGTKNSKTQVFELEGVARLEVYPPPSDETVQVRVEILGDHRIQASLSAGYLTLQSEALGPEEPRADFFLRVDKQTLHLMDDTGKKRLEWTPHFAS